MSAVSKISTLQNTPPHHEYRSDDLRDFFPSPWTLFGRVNEPPIALGTPSTSPSTTAIHRLQGRPSILP